MKIGIINQLLSKKIIACMMVLVAGCAMAQPSFTVQPQPGTIGVGGTANLILTINNGSGVIVEDLSFNLNLPASVTVGQGTDNQCNGTLMAMAGGTTISLADGEISASSFCQISVSVTSSTVGVHNISAVTLNSSAGSSMSIASELTVAIDRPAFTQTITPTVVNLGEPANITYLIDNSANPNFATAIQFSNTFPTGIDFAEPNNFVTDCASANVTETGNGFSVNGVFLLTGESCSVSVDVIGSGIGINNNQTSELLSSPGGPQVSSGFSEATLTVNAGNLHLEKSFIDDPTPPGGDVTLEYSIFNFDRTDGLTNIQFTDNLAAAIAGITANNLPANDVCGAGSVLSFAGGSLTLSGGQLPAEGSCFFTADLTVDVATAAGVYFSTSGAIGADRSGTPEVGNTATAQLLVSPAPIISKLFLNDPVAAGDSVDLEFTITNTSTSSQATAINFIDELTTFLPFPIAATLPPNGFCGAGSAMTLIGLGTDRQGLSMTGGQLAAADSCTFTVSIDIPVGLASGTYTNTSDPVSATVDGAVVTGNRAIDDLAVVGAPSLNKSYIDDPVLPGDTVTLEFSLTHGAEESFAATGISFTDDIDASLTGLVAVGLPLNDVCGVGSQISGTDILTMTGGTLVAGETCTFSVTLQVPAAAAFGSYTNTTSNITANVGGVVVANLPASDDLNLSGMDFTITNIPDTFVAGVGVVYDLEFNLTNLSPVDDATGIFATLNLSGVIPGLAATTLPPTPCGAGSSVTGTTFLIFVGGDLTAGSSCTFTVQVQMPASVAVGDYTLMTSNLTYTSGGNVVVADPASDALSVIDGLFFDKTFTDDPVSAGDTVTLNFDIANNSNDFAATAISFTDDLDATLSGLVAVGLPINDVCGVGSQITGTNLLTLTGGNIPAGGSCQFDVTLQVPANASGGNYSNTTSVISGIMSGGMVSGVAATDELQIRALDLSKSFASDVAAGSTVDLTFDLVNEDSVITQTGIRFTDDLNAMIAGAVAVGLPISDVCGAGSLLSGTDVISLLNASLDPSTSCQFTVTVSIPAATAPGMYLNVTSEVSAGAQSGESASDNLTVVPPPVFSKAFSLMQANLGQTFTLSFDIDNSASSLAANNLSFTDNLPAGLVVASPANTVVGCTGGTLTATAGTAVVSYSGGSVAAASSCQLSVDVVATSAGTKNNVTGDLTSDTGNSGQATASVEIAAEPVFSKAFSVMQANLNESVTLTFTIDNTLSPLPVNDLAFVDNFPAGLIVANPANASTSCTGGTLTAVNGADNISYTAGSLAANASCTVTVDVIGTTSGIKNNVSDDLTSTGGNSGQATASITIGDIPLFSKVFSLTQANLNQVVTLTFTIDNTNSALPLTGIDFVDNFPAGLNVANPANASTTCTGGTLTAVNGANSVSYTGGSLAAGATCVVVSDVIGTSPGLKNNITGDLTSSAGNSGTASADLEVFGVLVINKSFPDGVVTAGDIFAVEFEIQNTNPVAVNDISFTDDLDAFIPGAVAVGLPQNDSCGLGSVVSGTNVISLTLGQLAVGETCTITVSIEIPTDVNGTFVNQTSPISYSVNGNPVIDEPNSEGSANLIVLGQAVGVPVNQFTWLLLILILMVTLTQLSRIRQR